VLHILAECERGGAIKLVHCLRLLVNFEALALEDEVQHILVTSAAALYGYYVSCTLVRMWLNKSEGALAEVGAAGVANGDAGADEPALDEEEEDVREEDTGEEETVPEGRQKRVGEGERGRIGGAKFGRVEIGRRGRGGGVGEKPFS